MAEKTTIKMGWDLRRVCLIICGFLVLLIIFFSYAQQSHSGSGTKKHFKGTSIPNIRKHKIFHDYIVKTTTKPSLETRDQSGVKTTTTTSSMKLVVNSPQYKTELAVDTKTKHLHLQRQSLTRHADRSITNRLDDTRSNLEDTGIALEITSSVPDKQRQEADGRTTQGFNESFNNGTENQNKQRQEADGRTTQGFNESFNNGTENQTIPNAQLNDHHRLPLTNVSTKPFIKLQSETSNSLYSLSEADIQTLLKSELQSTNTTIAPDAEMTSQFRSVGRTILILGYHRTGSTLLGTLFKISPGTFYVFEPLSRLGGETYLTFINGTRIRNLPEKYPIIESHVLHAFLSCNLHQLPLTLLIAKNHVGQKDSLEHTVYCMRRYMSTIVDGNHIDTNNDLISAFSAALSGMRNADAVVTGIVTRCLKPAIDSCLKASVRVYKFIRLRVSRIKNILRDTTDVSLIHLLRDPRGNIPSQANLNIRTVLNMQLPDLRDSQSSVKRTAYLKEFISIANTYCSEVRTEMTSIKNFPRQYRNRIRMLLYEKFAMTPLTTARELYAFAGLPFLNLTEDYMWQLTLSGQREMCSYCVERGNATFSAFRWRETIHSTQLQIIDELCRDLYPAMGLRELRHISEVRNLSVPIFI